MFFALLVLQHLKTKSAKNFFNFSFFFFDCKFIFKFYLFKSVSKCFNNFVLK